MMIIPNKIKMSIQAETLLSDLLTCNHSPDDSPDTLISVPAGTEFRRLLSDFEGPLYIASGDLEYLKQLAVRALEAHNVGARVDLSQLSNSERTGASCRLWEADQDDGAQGPDRPATGHKATEPRGGNKASSS